MPNQETFMSHPCFHSFKTLRLDTRTKQLTTVFQLLIITSLLFSALFTQSACGAAVQKNGPNRLTAKIAAEPNTTQAQFVTCFNDVNPTPSCMNPGSSTRMHDNKTVLLTCLKAANAAISNNLLDTIMDKYRADVMLKCLCLNVIQRFDNKH